MRLRSSLPHGGPTSGNSSVLVSLGPHNATDFLDTNGAADVRCRFGTAAAVQATVHRISSVSSSVPVLAGSPWPIGSATVDGGGGLTLSCRSPPAVFDGRFDVALSVALNGQVYIALRTHPAAQPSRLEPSRATHARAPLWRVELPRAARIYPTADIHV